jgi:hypothetical protein
MSSDYKELSGVDYERLYARYLKDPGRLLRVVGKDFGHPIQLLDLCSGSGALLAAAIGLGIYPSNITAVEASEAMARGWGDDLLRAGGRLYSFNIQHLDLHALLKQRRHDLITCRQAVNYWWGTPIAARVCSWLAPGGVFVFNTFNTPPDDVPQTKQYIHEGRQYAEIAYLDGNLVRHVQACEGMPMHMTTFWYIAPEQFEADLKVLQERGDLAMFSRRRDGTTDTYVCYATGAKETP